MERVTVLGDLIDGGFRLSSTPIGVIESVSPADLDDHIGAFPIADGAIDDAVAAAKRAQPAWAAKPVAERCELLRKFGAEIKRRDDELVRLLGREVGKPAWEAKTEVQAVLSKIEITINEGLALVRDFSLDGGKLECRYRPHGVLGIIGPYNFPLHLAHGHIVPALATGNTVVFKPSEIAPACAQVYAQAALAAGFPAGVLNIVQGRGPQGAQLSSHPDIDGLLFTGSYDTGCRILQANATRPGRMIALELGGKNTAIVLSDAPWEKTLHDVVFSAFVTAGQRCTAVSRVVVERGIAERFISSLVDVARPLVVGHPAADGVFIGPLATAVGLDKFHAAQKAATAEGAATALFSEDRTPGHRGYYVTPSIHVVAKAGRTPYQTQEIFGPDIAILVADDLEHACALGEMTDYGLSAGVFTGSEASFEACAQRLRVGCIAWNAPTVGSSSRLPFGGVKNSGNHRPAALFSTLYCAWPLAVTRGTPTFDRARLPPGMPWPA